MVGDGVFKLFAHDDLSREFFFWIDFVFCAEGAQGGDEFLESLKLIL